MRRASGQHRQAGPHLLDPLGRRLERHQVGLEEVAVVVGVFLVAQRVRAAVALVPVTGLLADRLAGFEHQDLALRLVLDRATHRTHRVDVLDLAAGTEFGARPAHADVGVDAHRTLLHLGVGGTDRQQDRPHLVDVLAGLLGRTDVGATDDLDQRHARPVEIDQRVGGTVHTPFATTDMGRLAGVLLHVSALDTDPADPSGRSSQPSTLSGSSYWLIWYDVGMSG